MDPSFTGSGWPSLAPGSGRTAAAALIVAPSASPSVSPRVVLGRPLASQFVPRIFPAGEPRATSQRSKLLVGEIGVVGYNPQDLPDGETVSVETSAGTRTSLAPSDLKRDEAAAARVERDAAEVFRAAARARPDLLAPPSRGQRDDDEQLEEAGGGGGGGGVALPLEVLVQKGASAAAVEAALAAHPGGRAAAAQLAVRGSGFGRSCPTLLHLAVSRKPASAEVIRLLADASPEAAAQANPAGLLPLHVAMARRAPAEVVRALLAANPAAATYPNPRGVQPLIAAVRSGKADVVAEVIAASGTSSGLNARGQHGETALHLAARLGRSADVVRVLAEASPGAAEATDERGCTPLHVLLSATVSASIAEAAMGEWCDTISASKNCA